MLGSNESKGSSESVGKVRRSWRRDVFCSSSRADFGILEATCSLKALAMHIAIVGRSVEKILSLRAEKPPMNFG